MDIKRKNTKSNYVYLKIMMISFLSLYFIQECHDSPISLVETYDKVSKLISVIKAVYKCKIQ